MGTKDNDNGQKEATPVFLKFDGNYGGDKYEDWLCGALSAYGRIRKYSEKRLGGIRTLTSLGRLLLRGYRVRPTVIIRPFGLPVFRRNMVVVFHHFDHLGLPWYARLIEWFDMAGLRLTARLFNTKFLVVSRYWGSWLTARNFDVHYLIYNQVERINAPSTLAERQRLAQKYSLAVDARWVFLGGDQWKKGGRAVIAEWKNKGGEFSETYEFILSGRSDSTSLNGDSKTIWLEDEDYNAFLRQLHAVVANSKFDEGWCRVVHEAILSDVPVTGSGRGGMAELLMLAGAVRSSGEGDMVDFIRNPPPPDPESKVNVELTISTNNARELRRLASDVGL